MNNLLAVKDLHKSFVEGGNEIHVLRGVNLDLGEGERLAVVGESGVGKSTLLHILGTLDHFNSGQILFSGKEVPVSDEAALCQFRNRQIGFVFQFHYLLPDFSALENVMFPALVQGVESTQARRQAEELLEVVGLKDRLSHRPGKLSGGEQQRVTLARALAPKPRLIVADEPVSALDVSVRSPVTAACTETSSGRNGRR